MSAATIWILLLLVPYDATGRQVGPFATHTECLTVERFYNERYPNFLSPQSRCIEVMK